MPITANSKLLEDLNAEQRKAATHEGGPLLILAGAGTGKTRTLVTRLARLIERGVPPERILLLTFSRRASREMLGRLDALCGRAARRVVGGTFHAVAQRHLRAYAKRAGLGEAFTVIDRSDAQDLVDLCRESLGLRSGSKSAGGRRFPRKQTLVSIYSRCVNAELGLHDALATHYPWVMAHEEAIGRIFTAYEERKQTQHVLDFDDLLTCWHALLEDPVLGPEIAASFDHVLVDEYQDTNRVQRAILLALRQGDDRITVVGDDAQAIYAFRGATVTNIREFSEDFPDAATIRLEQSYRSSQPILAVANGVMDQANGALRKHLWSDLPSDQLPRLVRVFDEDEQTAWVIDEVLRRVEEGLELRRQAVLFRTASHSDLLEVELARRSIPFRKFGGLRFSDAAHVKDLVAFLRVVENPHDETAWFRVLKLLDGVGPKTAARVLAHLAAHDHSFEALRSCKLPAPARATFGELTELLVVLGRDPAGVDVAHEVQSVSTFYEPLLRQRYERPEARLEDLDTLAHVAGAAGTRQAFLTELTLDPPSASGDHAGVPHLDDDWLVLSTIHSAKGLEWDAVTVLRASDGMIPSDLATGTVEEIEEERRLFYVALTRARRTLNVVYPQRYHVPERRRSDSHLYPKLTRFLPPVTQELFETVVREAPRGRVDPAHGPPAATDIRARARRRW